jgi:putative MFS transporter
VLLTLAGFTITALIYVLSSFSVAAYVPELFPTRLRLRGAGLCNAVGRGVNILVPYAVAAIFGDFGVIGVETRQRSLVEIGDAGEAIR